MISYYTSIAILTWLTLLVLCILVKENDRIDEDRKRYFFITYILIGISSMAEWLGIQMEGHSDVPVWLLLLVKCIDYSLTPMAGGALALIVGMKDTWRRILIGILTFNVIFQIVACFGGLMVTVDSTHHYSHGLLYSVYITVYLLVITLVIIGFLDYSNAFRRQNHTSLNGIIVLILAGILLQELAGSEIKTAYIALSIGAALLFIHYSEFSQLSADDFITWQQEQIMTDVLTGQGSRYAYTEALKTLQESGSLPDGFAVFTIDINGLKEVNDSQGHEAGDELICGAAKCIASAVDERGKCYRTGGDEFVVFKQMNRFEANQIMQTLKKEAGEWKGRLVSSLSFSAGYALAEDHPELTAEQLVGESDLAMYEQKSIYYRETRKKRRGKRVRAKQA